MFRGRWRIHPALGVGLICAALLGVAYLAEKSERQDAQPSQQAQHATQRPQTPAPRARALQQLEQPPTAEQRQEARDKADVEAQQRMAWAAFIQAVIGFFGLLGLGFTVHFARKAWKEAQRATATAREQFELERRAWVRVDAKVHRIQGAPGKIGTCAIIIETENIGHSHALDVSVETPEPALVWTEDEITELAAQISDARAEEFPNGHTLFPGDEAQYFQNVQVQLVQADWTVGSFFFLRGWVRYRLTPGGTSHFTPFCFSVIYWPSQQNPGTWEWSEPERTAAVPIAPD